MDRRQRPTLSVGGPVSGAYSLSTVGPGSVALSGSDTYTGPTTISGGTLAITGSGSLGSGSYSQTITANGALVLNTSSSETFGGIIPGSGSLSQLGNSVTTLNAINTYTGGTTVSGGTLALGTRAAGIIRNALTINPGATVTASAVNWSLGYTSGTCVNSITINGGRDLYLARRRGGTSGRDPEHDRRHHQRNAIRLVLQRHGQPRAQYLCQQCHLSHLQRHPTPPECRHQ